MKKLITLLPLCLILLCGCAAEAAWANDRQTIKYTEGAEAFSAVPLLQAEETVPSALTSDTEAPEAASGTIAKSGAAAPEIQTVKADASAEEADPPSIRLLGPNMVYVGESFTYSFEINGETENPPVVRWICGGGCASVDENGRLEAFRKGEAVLTAADTANRLTCTINVHIVETAADVDFVPEVNGIPIVNKTYPLPPDYYPGDLKSEVYEALGELIRAAAEDEIEIVMISGFRSYGFQQQVHDGWVEQYGEEIADTLSARAGFSEHQLGYSADVNSVWAEFAYSPEGIWLAENCWKYGFVIRYPAGKEDITGYIYEPWHIRYLGKELARTLTESGLCLEEYLGVDSYYR